MTGQPIDDAWFAAHPLPDLGDEMDKDARGRALLMGGSSLVPGAVVLTGEAVLRSGAGKVKVATIDRAAIAIGVRFPEAAVIGLPVDAEGEIAAAALPLLERHLDHCDALIIGPGMAERAQTADLIEALVERAGSLSPVLLDAGALTAMHGRGGLLRGQDQPVVMTPHHGELARLTGLDKETVMNDPAGAAQDAAIAFGAIVVLKSAVTFIADGNGALLSYEGGPPGLGTAGSGDVLAGIIGGLLARGTDPLLAAAWGVRLHGDAGRAASAAFGPAGFLARDLLPHIPRLIAVA